MVLEARVWSFRSTARESIRGESLHVLGDPDLSDIICQDPGAEHRAIESLASESWQVPILYWHIRGLFMSLKGRDCCWLFPTNIWILRIENQSTCELSNRDFAKDSFTLDRKINFLKRCHLALVSGVSPSTTEEHTDDIQVKMKVNGLLSGELRVPWFAASY